MAWVPSFRWGARFLALGGLAGAVVLVLTAPRLSAGTIPIAGCPGSPWRALFDSHPELLSVSSQVGRVDTFVGTCSSVDGSRWYEAAALTIAAFALGLGSFVTRLGLSVSKVRVVDSVHIDTSRADRRRCGSETRPGLLPSYRVGAQGHRHRRPVVKVKERQAKMARLSSAVARPWSAGTPKREGRQ